MSTAVPLPLDPLPQDEVAHAEAQALRRAVTERLEQHRRRRGHAAGGAQHALPGMEANVEAGWKAGRPNRVADSVAARFAQSQSYREFLQQEAEAATRQAEAAAEIARRNAEAVAAAHQQLIEEMREWEERQHPSTAPGLLSGEVVGTTEALLPEAGVLLPMPVVAAPAEVAVLGPSELLRDAGVPATGEPLVKVEAAALAALPPAVPETSSGQVERGNAVASAPLVKLPLPVDEPAEPTTPIPANLIEFPRQLVAARKARPRLAEGPLREGADLEPERAQLRIFEVEASSFSTTPTVAPESSLPEWSSIRLDSSTAPHDTAQLEAQVSLGLPVYAAPLERRMMAAVVDGCCVGTAFVLAVAAAGLAGEVLPTGLLAVGASAVTLLLFGLGYLLLCFSLAGHTAGMRYARIALCTFGDDNPTRSAMRRRLLAYGLSAVSLGLGFLWALLDDEKLGWHDRISRMYQRAY